MKNILCNKEKIIYLEIEFIKYYPTMKNIGLISMSFIMLFLTSCDKEAKDKGKCEAVWHVKTSTTYEMNRVSDERIEFTIQDLSSYDFTIYQPSSVLIPEFYETASYKFRVSDFKVEGTYGVVGDYVDFFMGSRDKTHGGITPYAGVSISRGNFFFLFPGGKDQGHFFPDRPDPLDYEIAIYKNQYGNPTVRVTNPATQAHIDQVFPNPEAAVNQELVFAIRAYSSTGTRFGKIDQFSFSMSDMHFARLQDEKMKCGFIDN